MNFSRYFSQTILLIQLLLSVTPGFAGTMGHPDLSLLQWMRENIVLYVPIAGGYGYLKDAEMETAFTGVVRVGLGSRFHLGQYLQLGSEVGFQTGSQMKMNDQIVNALGQNALPVTLIIKAPVDILLTAKYNFYKDYFIEAKGGAAYLNTMISGADVTTNQVWMSDVQAGFGIDWSPRSSVLINYQGFYGHQPYLTEIGAFSGLYELHRIPTWQAIMFTIELKL